MAGNDFLSTYTPLANDIATQTGLDPSVVLGIIDTETGGGVHVKGNNIFGISPGGQVAGYPDVQTAAQAFVNLMQTPRYRGVAAAGDPASQAVALVRGGYNTANPQYASIVASKALNFGKQLGYQDQGGGQSGPGVYSTSSQPAPDYSDKPSSAPAASPAAPAASAPDYNITPPAGASAAPTQPPASGSAKDRVLADPALGGGSPSTPAAPAQPSGSTALPPQSAKERLLADPALQVRQQTEKPPSDYDEGYGMMARPTGPTIDALARGDVPNALAIPQGRFNMTFLPWTADEGTGANGNISLPGFLRAPLQGLVGGGGWSQTGNLTIDPTTGAVRLTPEASSVPAFAASPLNVRAVPPEGVITGGPQVTGVNPLSPEAAARANVRAATTPPDVAAARPPPSSPVPNAPAPPSAAPAATPTAPSSVVTPATPTTAAEALPVATRLLDKARNSGADLQPDYVNKFVDKVTADAEPAGPGTAAVSGPNDPVAAMVHRLQALRDQPLSVKDVMGMDQELNARQRAAIKTDPDLARRLGDLQDSLREQVDAATEADVGGGADGWNAFKDGRAAYSQYKKMQAVEDMKDRADGTQNPTSSYKTAVNNFVNGTKSRGWTDEEKASLQDSADRGVIGGTLHVLGSRLLPHVAGAVGASIGGIPGFIAGEALAHFGGAGARAAANALQTQRFNQTMGVLGSRVPSNPLASYP